MKDLTTLGLQLPTDPRWAQVAEKDLKEILIDHAYCEQKAASSCISLIVQFPEKNKLVNMLTPVVAEEWSHFEAVINHMRKRKYSLGKPRKDEYVSRINKIVRTGGSRDEQLVEKLLLNALIEARSAERFKILAKNINDQELADFYHELMVSEAGHYRNFLELAKTYMPEEYVNRRWKRFLEEEARIMKELEPKGDRMH